MTIVPTDISSLWKPNRTWQEQLEFLTFAVLAAGKNAEVAATKARALTPKIVELIEMRLAGDFATCADLHNLVAFMRVQRVGKRLLMEEYVKDILVRLSPNENHVMGSLGWLSACSLKDLTEISGVGQKTARFFLMHNREEARVAVLDVHVIRWMQGVLENSGLRIANGVQDKTLWRLRHLVQGPSSAGAYREIEALFLSLCVILEAEPRELDLAIWLAGRGQGHWRDHLADIQGRSR